MELPKIITALRALLDEHRPDERGRCLTCRSRRFSRKLPSPCRAYLAARKVVGERGESEVAQNSATWRNYLAPSEMNAVYGKVFERFMDPERRLFPGFVAIALALVGLWPLSNAVRVRVFARSSFRGYTVRFAYALGLLLAFDVSLGFNGIDFYFAGRGGGTTEALVAASTDRWTRARR